MTSDYIINYSTGEIISQAEILNDSGKPWRYNKMKAEQLAELYENINPRKSERLRDCATRLQFKKDIDSFKLVGAWFCRVRLCPMCQWRRSLKLGIQMRKIHEIIAKSNSFLLLTLTVKNVAGDQLRQCLTDMSIASNRMHLYNKWRKAVNGYVRTTEVTYNKDNDTYHPHYHYLLAVNKSYFTSRNYIPFEEWRDMWKLSLRMTYDPVINVQKVKAKEGVPIERAIAETCKYTVKPDDMTISAEVLKVLDGALDNKRMISLSGVVKKTAEDLNLADIEEDETDLVRDSDTGVCAEDAEIMSYVWRNGFYIRAEN